MSDINQASREAVEAAQQSDQFALILATIQATQAVQQQPSCGCQHGHQPPAPRRSAGQVFAYVAGGCAVAGFASALLLSVALVAVAVGIGGLSLMVAIRALKAERR